MSTTYGNRPIRVRFSSNDSDGIAEFFDGSETGASAIQLPKFSTSERDAYTASAGEIIYNETTNKIQIYNGSAWGDVGVGNFLVTNTFTGDGSDTTFTISNAVADENNLLVFIDGVFQAQNVYSISGTTLTFATAPANGRVITVYSALNNIQGANVVKATMTGDNSDTTLALGVTPISENAVQVYFDGVYQNKDSFSISGETLTFGVAPPTGVAVEAITHTVLDISAGWGDRLISAIACDVANYVACDPNTTLASGHREIIERFVTDRRERFKIIYEPFETATLPSGIEYDLVFTSPPFFDLEIYSDETTQSVATYNSANNWLVNFLFKSLEKAWGVLKVGGTMAIHITDTPSLKVCEPMVLFASWRLKGCAFKGVLGSLGGAGQVRPIWVFHKTSSSPHARRAERVLKSMHTEIYDLCKIY